jgi:2-methylcitrate dehydratase PrpD
MEAVVSLYHWTAAVLAHGKSGLDLMAEEILHDPTIVALREKITATAVPALAPDQATVSIKLTNGREIDQWVEHCLGSASNPMTDRDLDEKFSGQTDGILEPDRIRKLLDTCRRLDKESDAGIIGPMAARTESGEQERWSRS